MSALAGQVLGAFLDRLKGRRSVEDRAGVAARRLIPELETLRLNANEALRKNRPGRLTPEQAIPKAWTPDAEEAFAALGNDEWEFISGHMEEIQSFLREDFFPNLPPDGTVGREAALGALWCSTLCSELLYRLELLAGDRYWDPNKKIQQRLEQVVALERARLGPLVAARLDWTVAELVGRYLEQHQAAPATIARLRAMLAKATAAFGEVPVRQLLPDEIGRWAKRLPEGHRHDAMVALRQVLNAAVRWKVIEENPAKLVPNPQPRREEIRPFGSWEELDAVAEELGPWARSSSSRLERGCGRRSGSRSYEALQNSLRYSGASQPQIATSRPAASGFSLSASPSLGSAGWCGSPLPRRPDRCAAGRIR